MVPSRSSSDPLSCEKANDVSFNLFSLTTFQLPLFPLFTQDFIDVKTELKPRHYYSSINTSISLQYYLVTNQLPVKLVLTSRKYLEVTQDM